MNRKMPMTTEMADRVDAKRADLAVCSKINGIDLPDSGRRESFRTGAVRDAREGKGRFDLLPPLAIARLARHFEAGARKYGDRNWESGMPISRFVDSALRHLFLFMSRDASEDHLCAAVWNLMAAMDTEGRIGGELIDIGPGVHKK